MSDRVEWAERIEQECGAELAPPPDAQPRSLTIESADRQQNGWSILTTDSTGFFVSFENIPNWLRWKDADSEDEDDEGSVENTDLFKEGDEIVLWTVGFSQVVGLDLGDGRRVYRKSEREMNLEWLLYRAKHAREHNERFEHERTKLDSDYDSLPQVFKDRIDRFRTNNPAFRREYEGYEMFCCKEAVKFATRAQEAVATGEYAAEVDDFWSDDKRVKDASYPSDKTWEEPENREWRWLLWANALNSKAYEYNYKRQRSILGNDDGHSGNTFGAAMFLARAYLEAPPESQAIRNIHGALSPLVGSAAYGDLDPETGEPG